jgi:hypothetical protein
MKKVEIYSNWCYIDRLDEKPLKNGELLLVRWANGDETTETVVVKNHSYTISDMGSPWEVKVSEAYIENEVRGVKCLIRLAKENVLCERA